MEDRSVDTLETLCHSSKFLQKGITNDKVSQFRQRPESI